MILPTLYLFLMKKLGVDYIIKYHWLVIERDIPKLPYSTQVQVEKGIREKLLISPERFGRPLRKTLKGNRRLRVGDYRILYRVVEAHSFWANITTWVYALLALAYLLVLADRLGWIGVVEQSWSNAARLSSVLRRAAAWADTLTQSLGGALVALVGLIALTITGALGGSLIYGPAVDPIVELVYRLYGF